MGMRAGTPERAARRGDHRRAAGRSKVPLLPILHALQDDVRLCAARGACRWSPRRSTCRAPKCTASSPSTTISAPSPAGRHVLKLCRAEACQSMGGEALAARGRSGARHRLARHDRDGAVTLEPVYLSRPLRLRARRDARRRARRPARRRPPRRARRRRRGDDRPASSFPAMPARSPLGADEVARALRAEARPRAASTSRSSATARAASTGSSRWSRSRRPPGRIAYGPVDAERRREPVRCRLARRRRRMRCASAAPRTIPFLKRQTRLTFARCGVIDPLSLADYRAHGGLAGPANARSPSARRRPSRR